MTSKLPYRFIALSVYARRGYTRLQVQRGRYTSRRGRYKPDGTAQIRHGYASDGYAFDGYAPLVVVTRDVLCELVHLDPTLPN